MTHDWPTKKHKILIDFLNSVWYTLGIQLNNYLIVQSKGA